jgi:hypothetical protein
LLDFLTNVSLKENKAKCKVENSVLSHTGSRILDPKTTTKEEGEKKIVVLTFFVATNFTLF